MLECMQSLGRRSVEAITDYEYEFYNKYLSKYADGDISNPFIKVEPSDQIVFSNLKNLYSIAKAVPSNQRNMTDEQRAAAAERMSKLGASRAKRNG